MEYPNDNFIMKWLRKLPIRSKFSLIILLIIVALSFAYGTFWLGMKMMSGVRAAMSGESLVSKAHKGAVVSLLLYSDSYDKLEYENFLRQMSVLRQSREAREEMKKESPDWSLVETHLLGIGADEEDAENIIFLYKYFGKMTYMREMMKIWEEGTNEAESLLIAGTKLDKVISSHDPKDSEGIEAEIAPVLRSIYALDLGITSAENHFSEALKLASRDTRDAMIRVIGITNLVLDLLVLLAALFIERIIAQVDRSKSEFISLASHQLRTPPTNMKWLVETLLSGDAGPLSDKQKEYLEDIYKSNQRMITITNLLLNSSKMELGSSAVSKEEVDVADILRKAKEEYDFEMKEKNLTLEESYEKDLPEGRCDRKLLLIVFQNIIWNAIKYTPQGGKIKINASRGEKKDILVAISDTGYGIPENESYKVFTKLFRASNVKEKDTDGTGLGLYLSKLILNRMDGNIWFESEVGKGTTFYISIPVVL